MKNIPTEEELQKLAEAARNQFKEDMRGLIRELGTTDNQFDLQRVLGRVREYVEEYAEKTAERVFTKYAEQLLVGAHVSEIIRLVKK